jgi:hypothetical protein
MERLGFDPRDDTRVGVITSRLLMRRGVSSGGFIVDSRDDKRVGDLRRTSRTEKGVQESICFDQEPFDSEDGL